MDKAQAENVIYRSFVMAKEKRNIELAFRAGGQLAKAYPKSKYLFDVYATLGNFSAQITDFERAAILYEDFFSRFPGKPEAQQAMEAAAKFHSYLGQYSKAIKDLKALLKVASDQKRAQLWLEITRAYAEMNDWRMAAAAAKQVLSRIPDSAEANLLLGKAYEKQGKPEQAKQAYMMASSAGAAEAEAAAEAQFRLAEILRHDFDGLRFGAGQPDQQVLQNKMQLLQTMEQLYGNVVQMRSPRWAIASLYRLYQVYSGFAEFLKKAPVPGDLNAEQRKQYVQMVNEQVKAQNATARTFLDTCRKTVRQKKVFGPYALACITGQEPIEQVARSRAASKLQGQQVENWRKKLLTNPNDVGTLDNLARQAMRAGDWHLARLVLSKALEVDENHPDTLNLMGVVVWNLGDDQEAYAYFRKCLDQDSSHRSARANMAAMFYKYRDEARARAVLKPLLGVLQALDLSKEDFHPSVRQMLGSLKLR